MSLCCWPCAVIAFTCLILGPVAAAQAEFVLSAYGGKASTRSNDLELVQPGRLHLTFHDVSWADKSFTDPPYYGLRGAFYLPRVPSLGFAIDFTHAKTILQNSEVVRVTGTRAGEQVDGAERISDTIQRFELSHGYNLLTFNAMYRWFPKGERDASWLGRIQPYGGAGVGMTLPHVEAKINAVRTWEYQSTGPALQGFVGLNIDVILFVSVFGEYKITYADVTADLKDDGTISIMPVTHHFVFGVSLRF